MCKRTGCFGSFIRIILSLINIVFLLCGLGVVLIAAALKWADTTLISRFIKDEGIRSIIDVSAFDTVSWALLVLGAFIVLLSLIGLIGACCANRFFLVIYEIILVMLFLSHGVLLIIGGIKSAEVEKSLRNALEDTVRSIQMANHSSLAIAMKESETKSSSSIVSSSSHNMVHDEDEIVVKKCKAMKLISEMFDCCGSHSVNDLNEDVRGVCCFSAQSSKHACSNQIVHALKTNGINVIIIPNSVILCFEFVLILVVPFLIGRITKSKRGDDDDQFENNGGHHGDDGYTYHMKPTTYMHGGRAEYRD